MQLHSAIGIRQRQINNLPHGLAEIFAVVHAQIRSRVFGSLLPYKVPALFASFDRRANISKRFMISKVVLSSENNGKGSIRLSSNFRDFPMHNIGDFTVFEL